MGKQKSTTEKQMSSLAIELHWQLVRTKIGLFFGTDLFVFLAMSFMWIYFYESSVLGTFHFDTKRRIAIDGKNILSLTYYIYPGGDEVIKKNIFEPFIFICAIIVLLILSHIFNVLTSYYGEYKRIKKTLKPINEVAIKADELSRLSFDESKFHTIENAIENISPEQTTRLSLGDSDLQGIEAAMNNMLTRMHETYMQQARFVNDASHELRTPIAVIQGYANMLDRWGKEDEEILDESITAIKNESDHMNHLVEQLLFLARGDSGRNAMTFEDVNLNDIMRETYEESLMIDEKHIYKFNEVTENVHMNADASMIKQAMRILVDNAAKYTNEGDEIIISVGRNETGNAFIQVQDSGIGMAEVDVKHMFERFYRADDTRKVKGTGLGLSIAKWIVDKHNGHFEILSRKEIGTRIRIVF